MLKYLLLFCSHLNKVVNYLCDHNRGENMQFHTSANSYNFYSGQQYNFEQLKKGYTTAK